MSLRNVLIIIAASLLVGCVSSSGDKDGIYFIDNPPPDMQVHMMELPIADVMNPDSAERPELGSMVKMRGMITAVDRQGTGHAGETDRSFWLQDSMGCGPFNGVQVWNTSLDEGALEPGYEVDVTGTLIEHQGVLGLEVSTVLIRDTEPTYMPAHWLNKQQPMTGFEGMLVGVQDLKVKEVLANGYELESGLVIDGALTELSTVKVGDKVTAAMGVMRMYGDTMTLMPRAESDLAVYRVQDSPVRPPNGTVVDVGLPPVLGDIVVPPVIDIEIPGDVARPEPVEAYTSMQCMDDLPMVGGLYTLYAPHGLPEFATVPLADTWRQVLEVNSPTERGIVVTLADEEGATTEFPRDRLTFMFTCNGDCDSVDINTGNALDLVLEGYRTRYDDVIVLEKDTPEDGPQLLEVDLRSELLGDATAYYTVEHQKAWQYAVVCWVHVAATDNVASAETGITSPVYKRAKAVCKDAKVRSDAPVEANGN